MGHQEEPEHRIDYSVVCIPTSLDGLDSKLAAEYFEDILSLALVLRMTEALHGLSHMYLYVRAHFREVGLDGRIRRVDYLRTAQQPPQAG